MLECPEGLMFSHRHLWVQLNEDEGTARVGITEDYVDELSEILSVDMPMTGDELEMDNICLHLHVGNNELRALYAPLTGRVLEINRDVVDTPELLHVSPYIHYLFTMEYDEEGEVEMLLTPKRYSRYLDQLDAD